jgi:hypothetical protein
MCVGSVHCNEIVIFDLERKILETKKTGFGLKPKKL